MKIVSWNIQWGRGADGRVDLDRIASELRRIAEFDVLCLQEVSAGYPELPGCDGADQFAALAARWPDCAAIEGVAIDAPGPAGRRSFGNMLLSRLPVLQVFRHLLPWPPDGAMSMQRIALEATLAAPFGPLRVTTTHLEYYSTPQREAQVRRLRELHREAVQHARDARPGAASDGPFARLPRSAAAVLVGDFNFPPEAAERGRLTAPFDDATPRYVDAWEIAHPGRPHDPTLGLYDKQQWPGPPFTTDFAFVSADLAPRVHGVAVDAASPASDHQPLVLELR